MSPSHLWHSMHFQAGSDVASVWLISCTSLPFLPQLGHHIRELPCAGKEDDYKMSEYFSAAHKHNAFGVPAMAHSKRRLMERVNLAFPLHFSSKTEAASSGAAPTKRHLLELPNSALGRKAL